MLLRKRSVATAGDAIQGEKKVGTEVAPKDSRTRCKSAYFARACALVMASLGGALLVQHSLHSSPERSSPPEQRGFTAAELSQFTGDGDKPVYISILGQVFDVSAGRRHYGPGADYSVFAGRDTSRSFITGEFEGDGVRSDVTGLEPQAMKGLLEWRDFYHKTYVFKGYLRDSHYYDAEGKPMPLLAEVARGAKEAERLEAIRKANRKKHPPCNMKWTAAEGGQVWCNDGYPRLLVEYEESLLPKDGQGRKATERCACFDTVGWSDLRKVYRGCKPDAQSCKVIKS